CPRVTLTRRNLTAGAEAARFARHGARPDPLSGFQSGPPPYLWTVLDPLVRAFLYRGAGGCLVVSGAGLARSGPVEEPAFQRQTARHGRPDRRFLRLGDYRRHRRRATGLRPDLRHLLLRHLGHLARLPWPAHGLSHRSHRDHGGLLGVAIALILYARKNKLDTIALSDFIATIAPIGLFFGRIANFINGELWGKVTDVPWA